MGQMMGRRGADSRWAVDGADDGHIHAGQMISKYWARSYWAVNGQINARSRQAADGRMMGTFTLETCFPAYSRS